MPLHPNGKRLGANHADRLDLPILCHGFNLQALAETINGLYKAEVIHRRGPWRSLEAVEYATLEWVDWFNNRRLLEPIGNIPPAEAEQRWWDEQEQAAIAA